MSEALGEFGRFVMEQLRDKALATADGVLKGHAKAPRLHNLQRELSGLTDEQRDLVRRFVIHVVDSATHDFLFALQEANDRGPSIQVLARGENVASLSDGLQGEPFGKKGWQARFSKYGSAPDEA